VQNNHCFTNVEWHRVKKVKISKYRNLVIYTKLSVLKICLFHISLSIVSPGKIKLKSLYGDYDLAHSELSAMILALFDARTSGLTCTEKKSCSIFVVHLHLQNERNKYAYSETVSKNAWLLLKPYISRTKYSFFLLSFTHIHRSLVSPKNYKRK